MIDIVAALVLGIGAGIITGLIPGIHVNLIAAVLLGISSYALGVVDVNVFAVFIIAMAVVHTFLDVIPGIYLGAPDSGSVLAVLPGHRMLLEGRGYEAVKLTVIGSFFSMILIILFSPVLVFSMTALQKWLSPWIGWILVAIVLWMVFRERNRVAAAFVFLMSGVLGLLVLNMSVRQPLFPMLSGLFGISTLVVSLNQKVKIPEQKIVKEMHLDKRAAAASISVASIVGALVGFFPGLGPAQAAVIGSQFLRRGANYFLVLVGGISTANMMASLVTFYTLDKARNGAIVAVRELLESISAVELGLFLFVGLIAGCAGVLLTLFFAKRFSKWIVRIDYKKLCFGIIAVIGVLVAVISGPMGIVVLVVSTAVGIVPALMGASRSQSMGCLLLPVILFFLL